MLPQEEKFGYFEESGSFLNLVVFLKMAKISALFIARRQRQRATELRMPCVKRWQQTFGAKKNNAAGMLRCSFAYQIPLLFYLPSIKFCRTENLNYVYLCWTFLKLCTAECIYQECSKQYQKKKIYLKYTFQLVYFYFLATLVYNYVNNKLNLSKVTAILFAFLVLLETSA